MFASCRHGLLKAAAPPHDNSPRCTSKHSQFPYLVTLSSHQSRIVSRIPTSAGGLLYFINNNKGTRPTLAPPLKSVGERSTVYCKSSTDLSIRIARHHGAQSLKALISQCRNCLGLADASCSLKITICLTLTAFQAIATELVGS